MPERTGSRGHPPARWLARNLAWARTMAGLYPHPREGFATVKAAGFRGAVVKGYAERLSPLLEELTTVEIESRGRLVHEDRHKRSFLLEPASGSPPSLYVKHYRRYGILVDLKDRLRGSQARKSFLLALELARRGIPVPPPIAYLERWKGGIRREGYLLSVGFPTGLPLPALFAILHREGRGEEFDEALRAFGRFCLLLEETAVRHGALMSSILAVPGEQGPPALYLTDLEEVCTIGAICEHDLDRMAKSIHRPLASFLSPGEIEPFCEEGRRVGSGILQYLARYL